MIISRREVLALLLAAGLPAEGNAQQRTPRLHRETGYIDFESGVFNWVGGGRDPLLLSPEEALALDSVQAVLPASVAAELIAQMREVRRGPPTAQVHNGWRDNVMLSGQNGWIANNVIARPSRWPAGSSRDVWSVYAFDERGRQWRMSLFRVCSNVALTRFGAPVECVCDPARGDACRS